MGQKLYLAPQRYFSDCFKLTLAVLSSGFVPDIVCSVVRGGSAPANVFSDVLKSLNIPSKFVCVFMRSYDKGKQDGYVKIEGYTLQPELFWPNSKVLGLDDVFDSGTSQGVFVADIHVRNRHIPLENIKFGKSAHSIRRGGGRKRGGSCQRASPRPYRAMPISFQ